jgi:hypothetical protein
MTPHYKLGMYISKQNLPTIAYTHRDLGNARICVLDADNSLGTRVMSNECVSN